MKLLQRWRRYVTVQSTLLDRIHHISRRDLTDVNEGQNRSLQRFLRRPILVRPLGFIAEQLHGAMIENVADTHIICSWQSLSILICYLKPCILPPSEKSYFGRMNAICLAPVQSSILRPIKRSVGRNIML